MDKIEFLIPVISANNARLCNARGSGFLQSFTNNAKFTNDSNQELILVISANNARGPSKIFAKFHK